MQAGNKESAHEAAINIGENQEQYMNVVLRSHEYFANVRVEEEEI